ncbi:MAG: ester cyclase [Chloroflexota bacterium]
MNGEALRQFSKFSADAAHRDTLMVLADGLVPGNEVVLDALIAPEAIVHSPLGDLDREAFKAFFATLRGALADLTINRTQVVLSGDSGAARTVIAGRFAQPYPGPTFTIPPTGKPIELQIVDLSCFNAEDQIIEAWMQFDSLEFLTQLGIMVSLRSLNALPQC